MDKEPDRKPDEFVAFFKRLFFDLIGSAFQMIGTIALLVALLFLVAGYDSEKAFIRIPSVLVVGFLLLFVLLGGVWSFLQFVTKRKLSVTDGCMYTLVGCLGVLIGGIGLVRLGPGMIDRLF